jgi:hypothetical protein
VIRSWFPVGVHPAYADSKLPLVKAGTVTVCTVSTATALVTDPAPLVTTTS